MEVEEVAGAVAGAVQDQIHCTCICRCPEYLHKLHQVGTCLEHRVCKLEHIGSAWLMVEPRRRIVHEQYIQLVLEDMADSLSSLGHNKTRSTH